MLLGNSVFICGISFLVQTDHRPLLSKFGSSKGVPNNYIMLTLKMSLILTNFNFSLYYISTNKLEQVVLLTIGKVNCLRRFAVVEGTDFDAADEVCRTVVGLIFSGT